MIFELLPATIRMSTPLALAALGGIYSERAGVINIALEGMMLMGAFGYVAGAAAFESSWIGLFSGLSCGAVVGLLHAIVSITCRADQIVSGVSLNLLVVGVTEFVGRHATSERVEGLSHWKLPWGESYAFIVYLTFILFVTSQIFLFKTPWGLRLRTAGESVDALNALGLSRAKWQYGGVVLSGILAAAGGCYLASEAHYFTKGMTAGRGYVALAAVIFGKWKPAQVGGACLLFGFTSALELTNRWQLPPVLLNSLPYLLAMVVLVGVVGKSQPPTSLGKF